MSLTSSQRTSAGVDANACFRQNVPDWAKDEETFRTGEKVWKELYGTLETAMPGCVARLATV